MIPDEREEGKFSTFIGYSIKYGVDCIIDILAIVLCRGFVIFASRCNALFNVWISGLRFFEDIKLKFFVFLFLNKKLIVGFFVYKLIKTNT